MRTWTDWQVRTTTQRGSMAMLAAFSLLPCVILLVVMIGVAWLYDARQRADTAADALALGYANQMELWPTQNWPTTNFSTTYLGRDNSIGRTWRFSAATQYLYPSFSFDRYDTWLPRYAQVNITLLAPDTGINSLFNVLLRQPMPTISAQGLARINQVQLGNFDLARELTVFLFDFSRSMRLSYTGANGAGTGQSGLDVMRTTAASVLDHYSALADVGVLLFSDTDSLNNVKGALYGADNSKTLTSQDQSNHVSGLVDMVKSQATMGDGTDIRTAVLTAVEMLNAAARNSPVTINTKRLIIITDGEPDVGQGTDGLSYEEKVAIASDRAREAIHQAWDQGVLTNAVFMEREQYDETISAGAKRFLSDISGGPAQDTNRYHNDAGDPTDIATWLNGQAQYPSCYSQYPIDALTPGPSVPKYLVPQNGEQLTGWFDLSDGQGLANEVAIGHIFTDQDSFLTWNKSTGVVLGADNRVNPAYLSNPDLLGMWFDQSTHRLWLSAVMCAALSSQANSNNASGSSPYRVRMRWGAPRNVEATRLTPD